MWAHAYQAFLFNTGAAAACRAGDVPAAATCGSGLTAAVLALALHRCGAAAVPIYDGAWCEYEASGLPVVVDAE